MSKFVAYCSYTKAKYDYFCNLNESARPTLRARERTMIALVIAACLGTGECREFTHLYDPYDVSLMTCMMAGQPEVARWQATHPGWSVTRWRCHAGDVRSVEL